MKTRIVNLFPISFVSFERTKTGSLALFLIVMFFFGCGDPDVSLNAVYQPKIVVHAFVYPGEKVTNIRIYRNLPLNTKADSAAMLLKNATVRINSVPLTYNEITAAFETNALIIEQNKTYTLEAEAVIDGKILRTKASTTVPGGRFVLPVKQIGSIPYNEIGVPFYLVPGAQTDFYGFSIIPQTATFDNFIYNNLFNPNITRADLEEDGLKNYVLQFRFLKDLQTSTTDTMFLPIRGFDTWFYSDYRVIVYAGDTNFKNFVLTAGSVKEIDGNFHAPLMSLQGDGIGVFGSALKDTAYFRVIPGI